MGFFSGLGSRAGACQVLAWRRERSPSTETASPTGTAVPLTGCCASIGLVQSFELDVFVSQHQLKRITRLERQLLGIRGTNR